MLRDNWVGLIEPMLTAREMILSRCGLKANRHRTIDPQCLENPRPKGGTSTLAENVASPFHAEPKQNMPKEHVDRLLDEVIKLAEARDLEALRKYDFVSLENPYRRTVALNHPRGLPKTS